MEPDITPRFRVRACVAVVCIVLSILLAGGRALAQGPGPWTASGQSILGPSQERQAQGPWQTKIEPSLLKAILSGDGASLSPIVVEMREQPVAMLTAAGVQGPESRANLVHALQSATGDSQRSVRAFLAGEQSAGRADGVHPFWIVNAVSLRATRQTIQELAARDDVALVRPDRLQQWVTSEPGQDATASSEVEWGISRIRAGQVWSAFNITGTGVVVANMDTGVDYLHPALAANYRGCQRGLCQHWASWYDATDDGALYPQDGNGHGTHTMGTVAGQGGIGVAPGAQWIAVRVLNSGGYGYDSWIHAGFEWMIAPGGDPALAPQVVNNSWGKTIGADQVFETDIRALQAAGILIVFSNGNAGPAEGTVGSPASLPESFSVGATAQDDMVALFSSRGPSPWGDIRPHITAPGVSVRSAWPGGGFKELDGTSMAAPHVSGVAALVLSAHPGLSITATMNALTSTAIPLSTTLPNNESGWGRVDAYAAVMAVAHAGTLTGRVTRTDTGDPVPGAAVSAMGMQTMTVQADATGYYTLGVAAGVYTIQAASFGYQNTTLYNVAIGEDVITTRNLGLDPSPKGSVHGAIVDKAGMPVTATVRALGTPAMQQASGAFRLELPAGMYTIQVTALGYRAVTATVTLSASQDVRQDFALPGGPRILLVDSGAWYSHSQIRYWDDALDGLGYVHADWTIRRPPYDVPTATDLESYDVVLWSSPQDSPGLVGATNAITNYLTGTHSLLVSGQDLAYWDGGGNLLTYAPYFDRYMKAWFVADDGGSRKLNGRPGDIMAGLSMTIAGPGGANNQFAPDAIQVLDPGSASEILTYDSGLMGGQKVGLCQPYRGVLLTFGLEAITDNAARQAVLQRAFDFFASPPNPLGLSLETEAQTLVGRSGQVVTYVVTLRNTSEVSPEHITWSLGGGTWPQTIQTSSPVAGPCETIRLTGTVTIPTGLSWSALNPVTITAHSSLSPALSASVAITVKTPAPVLIVDDGRWYDATQRPDQALREAGVDHDTWRINYRARFDPPTLDRLSMYPIVTWFTGYDWYDPINEQDEATLAAYLEGGGRLFLSSPFYLDLMGITSFAHERLGLLAATDQMTTAVSYAAPASPIAGGLGPFTLTNPYPQAGFFTLAEAVMPGSESGTDWRGVSGRALGIHHAGDGARTAFMIVPFDAFPAASSARVLGRTVGWLGWLGDSTITAGRTRVAAGEAISFTLVSRSNARQPVQAALTATLPLSLLLETGSLSPEADYDPAARLITWRGSLGAGQAVTLGFRATADPSLAPGATVTVPVVWQDDDHHLPFDGEAAIRVAGADLEFSSLQAPGQVHVGAPVTYTLTISNAGPAAAASAQVTLLLPLESTVISETWRLIGPGNVVTTPHSLIWQGTLAAGQSARLEYGIETGEMFSRQTTGLLAEALIADGAGGVWERAAWTDVVPYQARLPILLRGYGAYQLYIPVIIKDSDPGVHSAHPSAGGA